VAPHSLATKILCSKQLTLENMCIATKRKETALGHIGHKINSSLTPLLAYNFDDSDDTHPFFYKNVG